MAELKKLESETAGLRWENERLNKQKTSLKALGKEETEENKKLSKAIRDNSKQIKENETRMTAQRQVIGVTAMSIKDLRARARDLKKELNNTSQAANPTEYRRLEKQLISVEKRMGQLRGGTQRTNKLLTMMGQVLPITSVGVFVLKLKDLTKELFNLAKGMQAGKQEKPDQGLW